MVRCGWSGYRAAARFGDDSFDRGAPVWCHDRFGMSLTCLPDGRFIQIAGEHEDSYDPDFCIYNDVIIHDGKGGFEILGYPEEVFPPTDFHSATLVGPWIYIIGNLGYPAAREAFAYQTPVYRFHTETGRIERVLTHGKSPGWIHRHQAELVAGNIRVSGGKILTKKKNGESEIKDHQACHTLDLETHDLAPHLMKHFAAVFLFHFAFSLAWLHAKDPAQTVTVSRYMPITRPRRRSTIRTSAACSISATRQINPVLPRSSGSMAAA
jgi:hypothetical protein